MRKFQPILQSFEHFLLLSIFFRHIYAFTFAIQLHGSETTSFHFIFRLAPFFCTPQTPICVKHSVLFSCHGSSMGEIKAICFFFSHQRPMAIHHWSRNCSKKWPFVVVTNPIYTMTSSSSSRAHTPVVSILTPESIDWISFFTASVPLQFQAKMGGKTSNDFWTNLNIASNYDHKWANVRNVRLKRWKHKKSTRIKWKHAWCMKMKMLRIFVICVLFPARWCNWAHHSQLAGKFYIVFTKTVNHPINRSINQTKSYQTKKALFWA